MDKIYVSIASYQDTELIDTVYSLLRRAKNPNRVFVSIFSQEDIHPNLEKLFETFSVSEYSYVKVSSDQAKGVGYARHMTQKLLSKEFKYYLQIDSHTRFIQDWDEAITLDYENSRSFWNDKLIFSSYPLPYIYNDKGNEEILETGMANVIHINEVEGSLLYKPEYSQQHLEENGVEHPHFCAGFAFGLSEYFLEVPYDQNIYFDGEEHTMSIRFFCKGIKIIAPGKSYIYHHYYGKGKRFTHWEKNTDWFSLEQHSRDRIKLFFMFDNLDGFGINNQEKYLEWKNKFINTHKEK
jgi:hypothetical protein